MLACLAHTEAVIDFGEEEEPGGGVLAGVRPRVAALLGALERHLGTGAPCSRLHCLAVAGTNDESCHYGTLWATKIGQ